jgi:branched-chain amino acid aminotransferase
MDTLTYWNGTWHEGNPAILGPRDHAFWLGSIVFDGGRAFEGCGPDLDLHAERVVRSARSLGLTPTKMAKEILELMHEAIRRFGPKAELYVRPMFWAMKGGPGPIIDPESCQFLPALRLSPDAGHSSSRSVAAASAGQPESAPTDAKASCLIRTPRAVPPRWRIAVSERNRARCAGQRDKTCSPTSSRQGDGRHQRQCPAARATAPSALQQRRRHSRGAHGVTADLDDADDVHQCGGKVQPVALRKPHQPARCAPCTSSTGLRRV